MLSVLSFRVRFLSRFQARFFSSQLQSEKLAFYRILLNGIVMYNFSAHCPKEKMEAEENQYENYRKQESPDGYIAYGQNSDQDDRYEYRGQHIRLKYFFRVEPH